MPVTAAVDFDPLALASRHRERLIAKRDQAREAPSGCADQQPPARAARRCAHRPGAALAKIEQRSLDPVSFEQREHPVERVALGDSSEIEPHPLVGEGNPVAGNHGNPIRADELAGRRQFEGAWRRVSIGGLHPEFDHGTDRHVEGALREFRIGDGELQDLLDLGVDPLSTLAGRAVESADIALGLVNRKQSIESPCHLVEGVERPSRGLRFETLERHLEDGTHRIATIRDHPLGGRIGYASLRQDRQQRCAGRAGSQESGASPSDSDGWPS